MQKPNPTSTKRTSAVCKSSPASTGQSQRLGIFNGKVWDCVQGASLDVPWDGTKLPELHIPWEPSQGAAVVFCSRKAPGNDPCGNPGTHSCKGGVGKSAGSGSSWPRVSGINSGFLAWFGTRLLSQAIPENIQALSSCTSKIPIIPQTPSAFSAAIPPLPEQKFPGNELLKHRLGCSWPQGSSISQGCSITQWSSSS